MTCHNFAIVKNLGTGDKIRQRGYYRFRNVIVIDLHFIFRPLCWNRNGSLAAVPPAVCADIVRSRSGIDRKGMSQRVACNRRAVVASLHNPG